MTVSVGERPRGSSTICLPFRQEDYLLFIDDPAAFRAVLDRMFADMPELFPGAFDQGYTLKDCYISKKTGLCLRRIKCKATGEAFLIRPSFVLPYLTARTNEVDNALYLRKYGVPFHALARVFGRNVMYWYRLEVSLGRNSIVGTTVRQAALPVHLLADEHHQTCDGDKVYVATTIGEGCCLGAALSPGADEVNLTAAYAVFKKEALDVEPTYKPQTVNTDGWSATRAAWLVLFPLIAALRCFLHGWLNIRKRGKHLKEIFWTIGEKVWQAFGAENRRSMAQRLRRLRDWARRQLEGPVREQVEKLCSRSKEYGESYKYPDCHRTSNMLDRVMRAMNRYFEDGQHLHGSLKAANQHCRAWALLYNFTPWSSVTMKANEGWRCPAERLNQHRYHDCWLQNLLVSASLAGFRR